jgi:hypothetical protein
VLILRILQNEAMQKRNMVPLPIYKTDAGCLKKSQWRIIDPSALSPWNVMSWGVRQLKGVVIGSDESSPKLQVQELVLVENLKVRLSSIRLLLVTLLMTLCVIRTLQTWLSNELLGTIHLSSI